MSCGAVVLLDCRECVDGASGNNGSHVSNWTFSHENNDRIFRLGRICINVCKDAYEFVLWNYPYIRTLCHSFRKDSEKSHYARGEH